MASRVLNARRAALSSTTALVLGALGVPAAYATDGTWTGTTTNEWTTGTNWSSSPIVPDNTATFTNNGAPTFVTISSPASIGTIVFTAVAPAYSFLVTFALLEINGTGIVNNSASAPSFTNNGAITFINASSAGNANIINNGAGNLISFADTSTVGSATITTNAGALTQFTANSTGGNAQFITGGTVDFSGTSGPAGNNQITAGSIAGAGTYSLGSNQLTVGGNNLSTTVSGTIQDGGTFGGSGASLVKVGSGTLTLSGNNTYTGATTVNAGTLIAASDGALPGQTAVGVNLGATLQIGDGVFATIGSLADGGSGGGTAVIGPTDNTTLLTIAGPGSTTFSGLFSGAGSLEFDGSGVLTLTGASNGGNIGTIGGDLDVCACSTGGVTIRGGALTVAGAFQGIVVQGGTLSVINGGRLTDGLDLFVLTNMVIDGAGSSATVSGVTAIGSGGPATLTISNGGALNSQGPTEIDSIPGPGTPIVTVAGAGSQWNVGGPFTVGNGTFGGPGMLIIASGGLVNATGPFMEIGDFGGSSQVMVTGAGSRLNVANALTIGVGTTGTLTVADGGVVNVTGSTSIAAGSTLNLGIGGLAGSIVTPTIANDGQIVANFTDTSTVAADISGAGTLAKAGAGALILTGNNSYGGGTTVTGGLINFNSAANFGTGPITLDGGGLQWATGTSTDISSRLASFGAGGATFDTNGNNVTLASTLSGAGGLTKIGSGTLILTGTDTYTGATMVNRGTLEVDGSIASSSSVTVNSGATLTGIGIVDPATTTINAGGTLAPGNSGNPTGTMTITGNLAFQSGARYQVQVTPSAASSANVSGSATLTGGSVNAQFASGSYLAKQYTILTAAGGLGATTFAGLTNTSLPAGFGDSLSYTATNVVLNLDAILGFGGGLNGNQQNVASAINAFFNNGGTLPPGFVSVFGLAGGNLGNALSQLSGEAATGSQQGAFQLMGEFLGAMLDPFVDGRGGVGFGGPALGFAPEREALPDDLALAYAKVVKAPPSPAASFAQRWTAWAAGYGGTNTTDGDPAVVGSHDLRASTGGFAAGADYRVSRDTVFGFALAGGLTDWSLAQGLGGGSSDAFQGGVYGATRWGPAYLAGAFGFANHWMKTDRVAAFGDHLTAKFDAQSLGGRFEGGYRFGSPIWGVAPYAAIQAQSFHTPTYTETDLSGGGFALSYNSRTATDTRSELGARFDHVAATTPTSILTLRGRLAWAHDWASDPTLAAVFQALPGAGFIVNGATPVQNSALASAGAELRFANNIALLAKFDGEFARGSQTYAGMGTLRYAW